MIGETGDYTPPMAESFVSTEASGFDDLEIPRVVSEGLLQEAGQIYRERWQPTAVAEYDLDQYVETMKESSRHFAIHGIARADLAIESLKRGYVRATALEEEKPTGDRAHESAAVHFCVDDNYWKGLDQIGLLCSVESLLENRTFMSSPLKEDGKPNEDWPVKGRENDPEDSSNKFKFDELGVVLVPMVIHELLAQQHDPLTDEPNLKSWAYNLEKLCEENDLPVDFFRRPTSVQERVRQMQSNRTNLPAEAVLNAFFEQTGKRPKRVFFYSGQGLEQGTKEFVEKFQLQVARKIAVSGKIELVEKSEETFGGAGIGNFYAIG